MGKKQIVIVTVLVLIGLAIYIIPRFTKYHLPTVTRPDFKKISIENKRIKQTAKNLLPFCNKNNYNNQFAFIVDMQQHSGKKRFFVYDFIKDTIISSGLMAHGSCNDYYLEKPRFDNTVGCGCSSLGKYKISNSYSGRFGTAYKLIGLDNSNNNAFERNVVLHAYSCVPNNETFPQPICNSLGCPMVSYQFLDTLSSYIKKSNKSIILWMID
ncbi:MAG: murein L,D-transpeptidase catalytic domain family protein [Bacteroidetes bacterium]|nr:murein L,D-transpeptidase catalytic domain family protein [Bacteroidota bacterium]